MRFQMSKMEVRRWLNVTSEHPGEKEEGEVRILNLRR